MAETIEELSYDYEDNGRLVRRELKREVLSKGAWCTIMFLFQELDRKSDAWRAPKIAIVRYKKWNGVYRKQSGFNISSEKQARAIVAAIETWYAEDAVHEPPPREESDDVPAEEAATEDASAEEAATEDAPAEDAPAE